MNEDQDARGIRVGVDAIMRFIPVVSRITFVRDNDINSDTMKNDSHIINLNYASLQMNSSK